MRLFISTTIIFIFNLFVSAQETTIVSFATSQDVLINSQNIQGGLDYLAFGSEGEDQKYRSILKFDLKDLPNGKIKHATLSLTMANGGNGIISLHKVLNNWKGSHYNIAEYANWESTGLEERKWNEVGGDFFSLPSGRAVFNDNETLDLFGPRMKLDIEQWIEDPSTNYGWIIMGAENINNSKTNFHSGKNLTQGPILTLIYELPDSCIVNGGSASTREEQIIIAKCPGQEKLNIDLKINNAQGENKIWLICSDEGEILGFSIKNSIELSTLSELDLHIYHLSFKGEILGASIGSNIRNLVGCYSLSNKIEVMGSPISGGEITTSSEDTEVTICPLNPEDIDNLIVKNIVGVSSNWAVIDNAGYIQIIGAEKPYSIKDLPQGSYEIRHLSYQGAPNGLYVGNNINDISGCYDWSNPIHVNLLDIEDCRPPCSLEGSILLGEELQICPSSTIGVSFDMDSIVTSKNHGAFGIWILTDRRGNTLEQVPNVGLSNYQVSEGEIVYLFHVTYNELTFQFRNNIYNLNSCYGISNGLLVKGVYLEGCPLICDLPTPQISSDQFMDSIDLCISTTISDLNLAINTEGSYPSRFIIRDATDHIISIGDANMELEFEKNGTYNLSQVLAYEDSAFIDINEKIKNENTCFSFSNNIILIQSTCPFICKAPENFNVSESDIGNVAINWERIEGASRYEFEIGFNSDTTDLTLLATSRNWIKLSNPSKRSLIFRVRSNCGNDGFSSYSDFVTFESKKNTTATARSSDRKIQQQEFSISPNPASESIYLEYDMPSHSAIVKIYDATGRLQLKEALRSGFTQHTIDVSQLETGIHILIISSPNGIHGQQRFIKIR